MGVSAHFLIPLFPVVLLTLPEAPLRNSPLSSHPNHLFKPPPPSKSPQPGDGRKVAFCESVDDIEAYDSSPRIPSMDKAAAAVAGPAGAAARTSKWQPLSSAEPSSVVENDPFSLGDSEDDKDVHKELKTGDVNRLKKATSEAMADSLVDDKTKAQAKAQAEEGGEPEAKKD